MKLTSVRYLTGEGIKNVWVNRLMSIASVGVLVACMVIIGLAVLITENVNLAIGNLEQQNVAMVYMKDYNWALYSEAEEPEGSKEAGSAAETGEDTAAEPGERDENGIAPSDYVIHSEEEALALCAEIEKIENVKSAEYVSSEEGLEAVKKSMLEGQEEYFTFLDDPYGNPMSAAARVTMIDMALFDETIEQISRLDGVDVIQSQSELAGTITAFKRGISVAGIWIISILLVISLVIVSNTIRVTMYNRKLEISIMKAVGATNAFIRIPFVVEGMIIGILSALLAEGVVYFCYRVATETIIATLGTSEIIHFREMAWPLLGIFAAIGILAGMIGSLLMIGKYLRKEGSEFSAF